MIPRPVVIATGAEEQLATIRGWWIANRPAAPELFDREVDAAVTMIAAVPEAFPVYREQDGAEVRRALLPRSRYAIYFVVEPLTTLIVAVWHTARGAKPPIP